jgi:hypothetical protein
MLLDKFYALAGEAGYEGRDRDIVLGHLASLVEALWPTGHLDQIAQACATHYDEGEAAALAEYEAEEARREAAAEQAGWAERERDAEIGYFQHGYHRDDPTG